MWLLRLFIIATLGVAAVGINEHQCPGSATASAGGPTLPPLSEIRLKITLLEPRVLADQAFRDFLNGRWDVRRQTFVETLSKRFPRATFQMVQVNRAKIRSYTRPHSAFQLVHGETGAGPFSCLGPLITNVFDNSEVGYSVDLVGTWDMLLAGAILPNYEKALTRRTGHARFPKPADTATFHVIVMFSEMYKTGAGFIGDGSDTCACGLPDPARVAAAAARSNTLLLLASPRLGTVLQWKHDGFDAADGLLYPTQKNLSEPDGRKYSVDDDLFTPFVRDRATDFICKKLMTRRSAPFPSSSRTALN